MAQTVANSPTFEQEMIIVELSQTGQIVVPVIGRGIVERSQGIDTGSGSPGD
jgi:hypothetical protein